MESLEGCGGVGGFGGGLGGMWPVKWHLMTSHGEVVFYLDKNDMWRPVVLVDGPFLLLG